MNLGFSLSFLLSFVMSQCSTSDGLHKIRMYITFQFLNSGHHCGFFLMLLLPELAELIEFLTGIDPRLSGHCERSHDCLPALYSSSL